MRATSLADPFLTLRTGPSRQLADVCSICKPIQPSKVATPAKGAAASALSDMNKAGWREGLPGPARQGLEIAPHLSLRVHEIGLQGVPHLD